MTIETRMPPVMAARVPVSTRPVHDRESGARAGQNSPGVLAVPGTLFYEQPLIERTRLLLRLEHIFGVVDHHLRGDTEWDARAVMGGLLDIIAIFGRLDLKSELIMELDRQAASMERFRNLPQVNRERVEGLIGSFNRINRRLYDSRGPIGAELRQNEFLASITQRSAIPGGTCGFDLPAYQFWLSRDGEQRKDNLVRWLSAFQPVREAVALLLQVLRGSGRETAEVAQQAFFQRGLDPGQGVQLIRVSIPVDLPAWAEISGGKHRFTVRFMAFGENGHPHQIEEDVAFGLTCCAL